MPTPDTNATAARHARTELTPLRWGWLAAVIVVHAAALTALLRWAPPPPDPATDAPPVITIDLVTPPAKKPAAATPVTQPPAQPKAAPPEPVPTPPPAPRPAPVVAPAAVTPPAPFPPAPAPEVAPKPPTVTAPASRPTAAAPSATAAAATEAAASSAAAAPVTTSEARFDADYLKNPPPDYPRISRRRGEEGQVILRVRVLADGRPGTVEIATGSGFPRLDEAAQETVRQWRFVPARRGSEAIDSWLRVPIVFRLEN